MQRNIQSLLGFSMEALDGEIGKVEDFYFDDQTWAIRYLILKTGNWLAGRKVLISTVAIVTNSREYGAFPVNLSKDQIRKSPDIDTEKTVSRQQEIALHDHYPWQSYWGSGYYPGGVWGITTSSPVQEGEIIRKTDITAKESGEDPHLRSTHSINGYDIHAMDGPIGHVIDFIIDDQTWQLTYLVINTHNWLGGKKVLLAVSHIKQFQWDNSRVMVDLPIASVKDGSEFEETEFSHTESVHTGQDNPNIHLK